MSARELSFIPRIPLHHGGEHRIGRRKVMRPIDPKRPLHLVMRSSHARGDWSLLHSRNQDRIKRLTHRIAAKWDVRVYQFANVGNHLHLLVKTRTRRTFQAFLRELAGAIAMAVTGARKTRPAGGFWDGLAFTRVVSWGRDLKNIELYFIKNLFEAAGLFSKKAKAAGLRVIPILGWGRPPE